MTRHFCLKVYDPIGTALTFKESAIKSEKRESLKSMEERVREHRGNDKDVEDVVRVT